jgi:hypothetical protein
MSTTVKAKTFVKQFVALVKGDEAEATAAKVQRKAEAAIEARLAALKGHLVDAEQKVSDSEEALTAARMNNGKQIDNREYYVDNLINTTQQIEKAKADLDNIKETIAMLTAELETVRS